MMRNAVKKMLAVVAMTAFCCSMVVPMTANAAVSFSPILAGCEHDIMIKTVHTDVISTDTHLFSYLMDVDDDGYDEMVVDSCTVEVVEYTLVWECEGCGYMIPIPEVEPWTDEIHSEAEKCGQGAVG